MGSAGSKKLHEAIHDESIENVMKVLDAGCSVDAPEDEYQDTPLIAASQIGNVDIIKLLIERKADLNKIDDCVNSNSLNQTNQFGFSALKTAADNNRVQVVQTLLNAKANVDVEDNIGATALHSAAANGYNVIIEVLLDAKADIDNIDQHGRSAIYKAIDEGKLEAVKLLVEKKASITIKDSHGHTPLHAASITDKADIVRYLLSVNADKSAKDNTDKTPLDLARSADVKSLLDSFA